MSYYEHLLLSTSAVPLPTFSLLPLYQQIADHLSPVFKVTDLTQESLQEFFVATDLLEVEGYSDKMPGLSGLQQLLGLTHPNASAAPIDESKVISSGNIEIDLMAQLFLLYKDEAIKLTNTYSIQYLSALVKQTQDCMNYEKVLEEKQKAKDKEVFEVNRDAIAAEFSMFGMPPI